MIDFNNPNTFPKELKNWGTEFEKMILRRVNTDNIEEWWQIEHQLQDIRIDESKLVTDFVKDIRSSSILTMIINNYNFINLSLLRKTHFDIF